MLFQACELNLTRLCFIDNDFRGNAMILLEETKDPLMEGTNMMTANYVTEEDADLDCPFAAFFATEEDRRNSNFTCIPPQTSECQSRISEEIPVTNDQPPPAPASSASSALLSRFSLIVEVIAAFILL
jgi:hypothetical protein